MNNNGGGLYQLVIKINYIKNKLSSGSIGVLIL